MQFIDCSRVGTETHFGRLRTFRHDGEVPLHTVRADDEWVFLSNFALEAGKAGLGVRAVIFAVVGKEHRNPAAAFPAGDMRIYFCWCLSKAGVAYREQRSGQRAKRISSSSMSLLLSARILRQITGFGKRAEKVAAQRRDSGRCRRISDLNEG
jgi:hypothetical protein